MCKRSGALSDFVSKKILHADIDWRVFKFCRVCASWHCYFSISVWTNLWLSFLIERFLIRVLKTNRSNGITINRREHCRRRFIVACSIGVFLRYQGVVCPRVNAWWRSPSRLTREPYRRLMLVLIRRKPLRDILTPTRMTIRVCTRENWTTSWNRIKCTRCNDNSIRYKLFFNIFV